MTHVGEKGRLGAIGRLGGFLGDGERGGAGLDQLLQMIAMALEFGLALIAAPLGTCEPEEHQPQDREKGARAKERHERIAPPLGQIFDIRDTDRDQKGKVADASVGEDALDSVDRRQNVDEAIPSLFEIGQADRDVRYGAIVDQDRTWIARDHGPGLQTTHDHHSVGPQIDAAELFVERLHVDRRDRDTQKSSSRILDRPGHPHCRPPGESSDRHIGKERALCRIGREALKEGAIGDVDRRFVALARIEPIAIGREDAQRRSRRDLVDVGPKPVGHTRPVVFRRLGAHGLGLDLAREQGHGALGGSQLHLQLGLEDRDQIGGVDDGR